MKALSTIVMRTEFLRSIGMQPDALGATLNRTTQHWHTGSSRDYAV
jgi:hypothetical protein